MVDLGDASTYAVLSGASVANTVSAPGAPHTIVRGDLGVKAPAAPLGFPPGEVTGSIRYGSSVDAAHADVAAAYAEIGGRQDGAPLAGALVGATITPGLHKITGAASNTGTVTFNAGGDEDAVFVIQVNGALAFAAGSNVVLTGGARASRIFWQVVGAGAVGAGGTFAGVLIARDAVDMGAGTIVNGRAFARDGAITLGNNQFYSAPPIVTITGGATAHTTDTTPTISGTTDLEAPGLVTVTIAGQTLTATPSGGAWSVTSAILPNGEYPVTASVRDGADNTGRAEQLLTVDTVLPEIEISGGATVTVNDPTPTVGGTTDAAPDTVVRVQVGSQALRALVQPGGAWNVTPLPLADGTHAVSASVSDPAGNESTATQTLVVDTVAPAVTVTGGPTALTNDATPAISGTAAVPPNSPITISLADETITGTVGVAGAWTVTAAHLSDGPHRAVVSVSDSAGNQSTATQILTVDTLEPIISIDGGATASTDRTDPTIAGVSDTASGSTVTVRVAGRTMSALVQSDGSWNTNAGQIGDGTWIIEATVRDPAGNVGSAGQTLSINQEVDPGSHELTVAKSGDGQGTVVSTPYGSRFAHGTAVTMVARAASGSVFVGWSGDCSGRSTCDLVMDQDRGVSAEFSEELPVRDERPVISGLAINPAKVPLRGKQAFSIRRLGPLLKLKLSEDARVRIVLTRKFAKARSFERRVGSGSSSFRIPWKIRRNLGVGRYGVTATATDVTGQRSPSRRVGLTVARR